MEYLNTDEYYKDMLIAAGLPEDEAERMIEDMDMGY
jgi:hypothetical protein